MSRSRETEDLSAMSWPILGQMTGGRTGGHHLDFYPIATSEVKDALRAAETVYQLAIQQIPQEVEESQVLLIYPEVEGDAVTITARDMEELLPERFLGNHIVDFYIRYLERGLSPERRSRFYFFNSFFFTKLLQSTAPTRIDPFKLDYEQIRKWMEEVNLFAKDYVFIPIIERSHWSLVIICNLSSLTCAPDEMTRFPWIVHLDPFEGQHESFEGLIKSYVLEAWMDRFEPSIDRDLLQHQLRALYQMKCIQAKVPQQNNSHDCGLYVLHYIEAFLVESASSDFSFASSGRGPHFARLHFATEVLLKRRHIQNLILELSGIFQERARKHMAIKHHLQELMQTSQKLRSYLEDEGHSKTLIKDGSTTNPNNFNDQSGEMNHAFVHELQSSEISMGNNEPLSGLQIRSMENENRCEHLPLQQQHVEHEVQIVGPVICNGPIFETKYMSTYEDAIDVQHQQSSRISKLDDEPLDGPKLPHPEYQRVNTTFLDKHQHLEPKEVLHVDLIEVPNGKNKRGRNMTMEETSILLSCKLEGSRFCKGSGGATHWNLIAEEVGKKLGSFPSPNQCRLRYDTLLKAYKTYKKYCMETGKTLSSMTESERVDLKLATTLSEEWYTTIGKICDKGKSCKRMKINLGVCNDLNSHDSLVPNPPPISNGRSFKDAVVVLDNTCGTVEVALHNVISASVLSSLNEDLQSTLLNLVQECSLCLWVKSVLRNAFHLGRVYWRLAILQDREPREILNYVLKLWELKLVSVVDMVFEEGKDLACIDLWMDKTWFLELELYEKISKEVLGTNPHLKSYCDGFPIEQSSLQYIRVLWLFDCRKVEHLDLREFPKLQSLTISYCPKLNLVSSWEVAISLESLGISHCNAYRDFPNVRYLFSLKEIEVHGWKSNESVIPWQLSQFSQCNKLQRLDIAHHVGLSEIVDLETLKELKSLESLSLSYCSFSCIRGLGGLQTLTRLRLWYCPSLRRVPELGYLKALTHLELSCFSIEDVVGIGELHLLTWLNLYGCASLKWLPFLGHLKALVHLNLMQTSIKEILGREGLVSLKTLYW